MFTVIIAIATAFVFAGTLVLGWYLDQRWGRGAKKGMSPEMELEHARWSNRPYW